MNRLVLTAAIQLAAMSAPVDDFHQAYRRSLATGKPLVVLVGAKWCPGCQVMSRKIIPQVAGAGGLAGVEFAYVDVDRQADLAGHLLVGKAIPQLICLRRTPMGWLKQHLTGAHSAATVSAFIATRATADLTADRRGATIRTVGKQGDAMLIKQQPRHLPARNIGSRRH